jgi:hypothetical protein
MSNNGSGCGTGIIWTFLILAFLGLVFQNLIPLLFLIFGIVFICYLVWFLIIFIIKFLEIVCRTIPQLARWIETAIAHGNVRVRTTRIAQKSTQTTTWDTFKELPDDINNILQDLSDGEIKDPITQEPFKPGDTVYLCHRHRLAYHQDSWDDRGRQCIDCKNDAHTKKYTLPLISKSNLVKDILWQDLSLELPIEIKVQQPEFVEVREDDRSGSRNSNESNTTNSRIYVEDAYINLYRFIDLLTQIPVLEVSAVQNILGVMLHQVNRDNSITEYEANNLRGSLFSSICLSQLNHIPFLHLEITTGLIPLSEIITHYNLLFTNRQGLMISFFEKEINQYKVRFYSDTNAERSLIKLLLYPLSISTYPIS